MTCYSRAFMPRGRHHFSAPWPLIMHRRVARLLILFYSSLVSGPVILSAAGAKDLLFVSAAPRQVLRDSRSFARAFPLMREASASRSFARARSARSLRMTAPRGGEGDSG